VELPACLELKLADNTAWADDPPSWLTVSGVLAAPGWLRQSSVVAAALYTRRDDHQLGRLPAQLIVHLHLACNISINHD
jgi:hypothetical protein